MNVLHEWNYNLEGKIEVLGWKKICFNTTLFSTNPTRAPCENICAGKKTYVCLLK